jgi:glycosyltransferase involved in cell wall biosynthesis
MAAGVPVIATACGCIRTVVGDRAGVVVARDQDFPTRAAQQVLLWMEDSESYRAASEAASDQAAFLHRQAGEVLEKFVEQITDQPSCDEVDRRKVEACSIQEAG